VAIDTRRVCIVHDGHGIAALSTSCTHLGCIAEQAADGFVCRCHGSRFDRDGRVTGEPARAPLAWFAVRRTADGDLEVDTSVEVAPGTYFAA
jgi:Rieske Fe-S protein